MNAKTLTLAPALLLSLVTLSAVGCSKSGASPTEPVFLANDATATSANLVSGESRVQDPAAAQQATGNGLTSNREAEPGDDHGGGNNGGGNGGGHHNGGGADDTTTGSQFHGAVASITGSTITLATGAKVTVNTATVWSARGDLLTLAALRTSFNRNQHPRVEGRGTRQANGSILAKTLKAEF
ncbi:MAG TPA: hypothetical protein VGS22_27155 [Thermoanaerobaculia bacterium]|jgi:hypothetical protein|nr:hypothetical protein [Thermoanaerobaculia bacterium]